MKTVIERNGMRYKTRKSKNSMVKTYYAPAETPSVDYDVKVDGDFFVASSSSYVIRYNTRKKSLVFCDVISKDLNKYNAQKTFERMSCKDVELTMSTFLDMSKSIML